MHGHTLHAFLSNGDSPLDLLFADYRRKKIIISLFFYAFSHLNVYITLHFEYKLSHVPYKNINIHYELDISAPPIVNDEIYTPG